MALFEGVRKEISAAKVFATEQLRVGRSGIGFYNYWPHASHEELWLYQLLTRRPLLRKAVKGKRISIFSVFGPRKFVGLDRSDLKIFYTGENLARYPDYADHLAGQVDLCLGFDAHISQDNYLRLPLWISYLVPADFDAARDTHIMRLGDPTMWMEQRQKKQFAALVARHDENGIRAQISDTMTSVGRVDYGGEFRFNLPQPLGPSGRDKAKFLTDYRYNICPENSNRAGYVTEKLLHAIQAGCVPVYWGSDNRPEPEVFNPAAILFFDPARPAELVRQVMELEQQPALYRDFAAQERFQPTALAFISEKIRTLEQRLLELLKN